MDKLNMNKFGLAKICLLIFVCGRILNNGMISTSIFSVRYMICGTFVRMWDTFTNQPNLKPTLVWGPNTFWLVQDCALVFSLTKGALVSNLLLRFHLSTTVHAVPSDEEKRFTWFSPDKYCCCPNLTACITHWCLHAILGCTLAERIETQFMFRVSTNWDS